MNLVDPGTFDTGQSYRAYRSRGRSTRHQSLPGRKLATILEFDKRLAGSILECLHLEPLRGIIKRISNVECSHSFYGRKKPQD